MIDNRFIFINSTFIPMSTVSSIRFVVSREDVRDPYMCRVEIAVDGDRQMTCLLGQGDMNLCESIRSREINTLSSWLSSDDKSPFDFAGILNSYRACS